MNELVLKHTIQQAMTAMAATLDRFDESVQKAEDRAGRILGQLVKESAEGLRQALHADIGAASVRAHELVQRVDRAHGERSSRFWGGVALLCVTVLCAASFWLGRLTALP
jgi:hypothetical protein